MSNACEICRHLIIQHFSTDKGLQKKIKSNLAKSDSRPTARKYFSKINESFSCVLIGIGLGFTNVVRYPTILSLGRCSKSTGREKYLDVPLVFAGG